MGILITLPPARVMESREREELRGARRAERDPRVRDRILAVRFVLDHGMTRAKAASLLDCDEKTVRMWVSRYASGGLGALRDLPRPGRPPVVPRGGPEVAVREASASPTTPAEVLKAVAGAFGEAFHPASVRRIMRGAGLSCKRPSLVHANRASRRAVRRWQKRMRRRIGRLRAMGYTILVQDESIFVHDAGRGAKYWPPVGERVHVLYTGSHRRFVVFGALAEDGRQLFRTYDRFDAYTFVVYLRELRRKFGKVAVILDRAPQHRAAAVREFLGSCGKTVKLISLPVGSPQLNAVEEAWRQAKRALLNSEHHETAGALRRAIGDFFRGVRYGLDIHAYLAGNVPA